MTIKFYRYKISLGILCEEDIEIVKETPKCYFGKYCRLLKSEDGKADIKDRTCYPYIDFFDTKNPSREHAVSKIAEFFHDRWGLS